jgi:redox-sensitive bicupin YhaK (pirin superfamily)
MFPLLDADNPNPLEMFQIWLNLPAADKMVDPYFTMLWKNDIPIVTSDDGGVSITVITGSVGGVGAPTPPPNSWASKADSDVAIWHLRFEPRARWILPAVQDTETKRLLYAFAGSWMTIEGERLDSNNGAMLDTDRPLELVAGDQGVECMVLQGRPIGEQTARYGPFVMNTDDEIRQAFSDYRETGFGGWPWPTPDPNHGPTQERFARHADGRVDTIDRNAPESDFDSPLDQST